MSGKAFVQFVRVQETYEVGKDISIDYVVPSDHSIHTFDWIGLFKTGWVSKTNFYTFVRTPYPDTEATGAKIQNTVVLHGTDLPSSDGCFYQFCYFTYNGNLMGASSAFQFVDETIESVDENGITMPGTIAILEAKLEEAQKANAILKRKLTASEDDCKLLEMDNMSLNKRIEDYEKKEEKYEDDLMQELQTVEGQMSKLQEDNNKLKTKVEFLESKLKESKRNWQQCNDSIKEKENMIKILDADLRHATCKAEALVDCKEDLQYENKRLLSFINIKQKEIRDLKKENKELRNFEKIRSRAEEAAHNTLDYLERFGRNILMYFSSDCNFS